MTFGELVKVMNTAKVFGCNRNQLGVNLLQAAKISVNGGELTEDRVAKWIDKKLPGNITSYFPDETLNGVDVISYFRRWTKDKWRELQGRFSEEMEGCIVNCTTDNRDEFYQSLLDQFTISLGLPLPEEPFIETPAVNEPAIVPSDIGRDEVMPQSETPPEQMLKIFKQAVLDFDIGRYIKSEPTDLLNSDFFDKAKDFIESIKSNMECEFIHYKEEIIYKAIIDFTRLLSGYSGYLRTNTREMIGLTDTIKISTQDAEKVSVTPYQYSSTYAPSNGRDESEEWKQKYATETDNYRKQIESLYRIICGIDIE
ncbi:MAG: hypothetical protein LBQ48_02790 [Oscillospiraceae bacterium]|jgi:hypothetical protein|nr:hypothetical protein [Oscillospiraceae bacterium]